MILRAEVDGEVFVCFVMADGYRLVWDKSNDIIALIVGTVGRGQQHSRAYRLKKKEWWQVSSLDANAFWPDRRDAVRAMVDRFLAERYAGLT